jgi:hypothetical protein
VQVKIAKPGGLIEYRANLFVGEVGERSLSLVRLTEEAGDCVTWKSAFQAFDRLPHPFTDQFCTFRLAHGKLAQTLPQTFGVELMNGENSRAALRTPRFADQPVSAAAGSIGQCCIDNLDKRGVAWRDHKVI